MAGSNDGDDSVQHGTSVSLVREIATDVRRQVKQSRTQKRSQVSRGHNFKQNIARDQLRVQYGDVYNVSPCSCQSLILKLQEQCMNQQKQSLEQQRQLQYLLTYLQSIIPRAIGGRISVFEDALGRTWRIDLDTICTWKEFDGLLLNKFENDRGLQRVQNGRYILRDPSEAKSVDCQLMIAAARPGFLTVFKAGQSVRMSIHFSWDEVGHHGCPKCFVEQQSLPGLEVTCLSCGFVYTSGIEEVVLDKDPAPNTWDFASLLTALPCSHHGPTDAGRTSETIDLPEHFKRVSANKLIRIGTQSCARVGYHSQAV